MRWKFSRGLTSRCSVEFSLAYSLGIIAGFHPSSININFPFLRSRQRGRGAGAPVRCTYSSECKFAFIPLQTRNCDVERLRFLCSKLYERVTWSTLAKCIEGVARLRPSKSFRSVFRHTRNNFARSSRRFRAALSFRSLRAADPSVPLLPPRRADRFSRVSICGSMGIF